MACDLGPGGGCERRIQLPHVAFREALIPLARSLKGLFAINYSQER